MNKKFSLHQSIYLSLAIGLSIFIPSVTMAQWSAPSQTPPSGDASTPLNVSGTAQTKTGGVIFNTGGATNGLLVQYGKVGIDNVSPAYSLDVTGDIRAQNAWLRNTGSAGWYNETWGGGWYMSDSSWLRSYLDKGVYTAGEVQATTVRANTNLCISTSCITAWPSGSLTGSGTTNYIPKWTAGTALGNSLLTDDGTTVSNSGAFYNSATGSWLPYSDGTNYLRGATYLNNVLYKEGATTYQMNLNGVTRLNDVYPDQIYNYGWFRNQNAGTGLYNTATGGHFYSESANYWTMDSAYGMIMRDVSSGSPRGYLYAASGSFGLLSPDGNWRVSVDNTNTVLSAASGGAVYLPATYANYIYDRDNGSYYLDLDQTTKLHNFRADYGEVRGDFHVLDGSTFWVHPDVTSYFDGYVWIRGSANGANGHLDVGDGASNPNGTLTLYGSGSYQGSWSAASDRRLKTNIVALPDALDKIQKINGVSFNWKSDGKPSIGVIAQDVEKVYPDLVVTDSKTGMKSVEYEKLVAPLIEAVKEQQKQIDGLKTEIESLKNKK